MAEIPFAHGVARDTNDTEELIRECDILSLHLSALPSTHHLINASRLGMMKSTGLLVNTARGSLIDEAALYEALVSGRGAGAALDVFEHEPYQASAPGKDLRHLSNVVLTPHVASNTREANRRTAEACLANSTHFFAGDFPRLTQLIASSELPADANPAEKDRSL